MICIQLKKSGYMKIAICKTDGFCPHWVDYCEKNNIEYKLVNPYDSNIIQNVADCDCFMWHHSHVDYRDNLFAKQLIYSLENAGKKCFPDFYTTWHFDDKVGQKYLLESIKAPLVPSYVFYTKEDALKWLQTISFPKVFKLRGGAGSSNVLLMKDIADAKHLVKKAFSTGFTDVLLFRDIKERIRKWRIGKENFIHVLKGLYRFFIKNEFQKMSSKQKGYVYFQDFIPNNEFDIRVIVIGDKAFSLKRLCRENDFRASGSGNIIYDKEQIDERCVKIAFDVNQKLHVQSIAYDFVFDENNNPLIVEISYGYAVNAYDKCEGYWTSDMQWHAGKEFDFCGWMIENLIKEF